VGVCSNDILRLSARSIPRKSCISYINSKTIAFPVNVNQPVAPTQQMYLASFTIQPQTQHHNVWSANTQHQRTST